MTKASELLFGDPFDGAPFPPQGNPSPAAVDGRTACLRVLGDYLSELVFRRAGDKRPDGTRGEPIRFRIRPEDIHVEWPDHEDKMQFPSAVLLAGSSPAEYDSIGLTPTLEEATADVLERDAAVWWMSENVELVQLEVWCNTKAERRAIKAGLEEALVPLQQMYGLRFTVPDYYGQVVTFALQRSSVFDEPDGARGRRRVRFELEMRFNQVALARQQKRLTAYSEVDVGTGVDTSVPDQVPPERRDPARPGDPYAEDPSLPRDPCC